MYVCIEMGATPLLSTTGGANECPAVWLEAKQKLDKPSCPAAYCPPGSICGLLSIPRALPPVTHGSALQAPECLWDESSYWKQDKNQDKPLGEDGGRCPCCHASALVL